VSYRNSSRLCRVSEICHPFMKETSILESLKMILNCLSTSSCQWANWKFWFFWEPSIKTIYYYMSILNSSIELILSMKFIFKSYVIHHRIHTDKYMSNRLENTLAFLINHRFYWKSILLDRCTFILLKKKEKKRKQCHND